MRKQSTSWWGRSNRLKRTLTIGGVLLGVVLLAAIGVATYLLRPDASLEGYSEYLVNNTEPLPDGQVAVTFFGVSSLLFDDGSDQILTDAFFTRPGKVDFLTEMEQDPDAVSRFIDDFNMDRLRAVFIAHSHVDHAIDVPAMASQTGAMVYGTGSTMNIGLGGGVPKSQLALAAQGDVIEVGAFTIEVIESPHSEIPGFAPPPVPPTIDEPLTQPATNEDFAEGGNLSFVITHGDQTYAVVPSANSRPGMLEGVNADVAFIATALLGMQDNAYQQAFLEETVDTITPEIVVPLHWDNFLIPWKSGEAQFNPRLIDSEPVKGFELLIERTDSVGGTFVLLQAGSRIVLDG